MTADLDQDDIAWLRKYAKDVADEYSGRFQKSGTKFPNWKQLIERFQAAIDVVIAQGRTHFHAVDEAHNELCIADGILATGQFAQLDYEPALRGTGQTIDYRGTTGKGIEAYVDVKTINPKYRDRWDQFEQARRESWLPDNVEVVLGKKWLGGEIWHSMFASRSRMLEYTLELEAKISAAGLANDKTTTFLALCGNGFDWHEDELEDFVNFYRSGDHRPDDPWGKAEAHHMNAKNITLQRTISRFAYLRRSQFDLYAKRLNWNVQAPQAPQF
ncbi:MAG: hypothetical protein ACOY4R_09440 [Pseudomonadota bacterium]